MTQDNPDRLYKYDNLRGIAIILIVLGHLIVMKDSGNGFNYIGFLKNILFIIHIPLLFFVAGYFSKIRLNDPIKAFKRILIPYILFCIILRIYFTTLFGLPRNNPVVIYSEYGLWFLISLFTMKMSLPIIDKLKYPILTSIMMSIVIGFVDISHGLLGITKAFAYMPVFLTGFYFNAYKEKYISNNQRLKNIANSKAAIICIAVIITIAIIIIAYIYPIKFIRYNYSYNLANLQFIEPAIGRIILTMLQIGIVLLANSIVTNRKTILTKIGMNSMAIYILHLFVKKPFRLYIINFFNINDPAVELICTLILTAVVVFVFSRDFVSIGMNKFTDAFYNLFFKPVESKFTEK